jgi:hypothetical protein|nr:MAG TPA: PaaX-like protein [Caudoviricetes sp.]
MANVLTEGAEMLTSSLVWGGRMTFDQINELDWLKTKSYYGINLFIQEAERKGWIKAIDKEGKPTVYCATSKGRKMAKERE